MPTPPPPAPPAPPAPLARRRHGRLVGGVCAGVAARAGLPVGRVRAAVAAATLVFGLGAVVYVAAWLVLPDELEDGSAGGRAIVAIAQSAGALLGLAALAGAGGLATLFGLGWAVVAAAAALLAGVLATWPRVGPGWALLPIGALVLPSVAVAASGARIDPSTASVRLAPATLADLPADGVRAGLGTIEVDLRRTALPASGTARLRVDAGVRRTLVALPHDRCVRVVVRRRPLPVLLRAAAGLADAGPDALPEVVAFGRFRQAEPVVAPRAPRALTLEVDFASDGGELVVRDFPDGVDPATRPDWPGYPVSLEPRPETAGLSRREARRLVRSWRARRREQASDRRRIARLMPGPCARAQERRR